MPTVENLDIQITATMNNASASIDNLIKKINTLQSSMKKVGGTKINGVSSASSQIKGLSKNTNNFSTSASKASRNTKNLSLSLNKVFIGAYTAMRGMKKLWNSIESTADYLEAFNYFEVALNKVGSDWASQYEKYGYKNADAYANSFKTRLNESLKGLSGVQITVDADGKTGLLTETGMKSLGLNIQEVTQYASQLASVTNSVGQTGEVSLATASAFTKLGADMSSLFNVDYKSVMNNLQSGLIGQSRALYKYGIDITNATLQTYAYDLGLSKAVSEMTQAEKMQLRMIAILDQSKVSWGDLANTINSPSNAIRQFKNNLKEVSNVFGQLFIPVLSKVMPVINGVTIAIKRMLVSFASLVGIKLDLSSFGQSSVDVSEGFDSVSDSLDNVSSSVKKARAGLRGFDELKVINTPSSSGGSGGSSGGGSSIDLTDEILKATEEYEKAWNEAFAQMENKANAFADKITKVLEPVEKIFQDFMVGDYFQAGQDVSNLVIGINDFFARAIDNVDWYGIGTKIGDFLAGVDWIGVLNSIGNLIWQAINAGIELWKGSFDAAPIETTIFTSVALLKFTGLGSIVWGKVSELIGNYFILKPVSISMVIDTLSILPGTASFDAVAGEILLTLEEEITKLLPDWAVDFFGKIVQGIAIGAVTGSWIPVFGTIGGAIIGGILGALDGIKIDGKSILRNIIDGIFNWDFTKDLFKKAGDFFKKAKKSFEERDWPSFGKNIVLGIINGIGGALAFIVEPIGDLFDETVKAIRDFFGIHSPATKMESYGENILLGIVEGFKGAFSKMTKAIEDLYKEKIRPMFTKEKWKESMGSIKNALSDKWTEAKNWWGKKPVLKKISTSIFDIKNELKDAWSKAKEWWNKNKPSLSEITAKIKLPHLKVEWDTEGWGAKALQKLGLKGFPNFSVKYYASGGFPEDGWFRANHGEIMGKFDNGKSVVANNMQITEGISNAVYQGNREMVGLMYQELSETRRQNELLTQILAKEYGITKDDVGRAAQSYAKDYFKRTGRDAYSF